MFLHLSVSHSVHSGHRSGRYASYWNAYLLIAYYLNEYFFGKSTILGGLSFFLLNSFRLTADQVIFHFDGWWIKHALKGLP